MRRELILAGMATAMLLFCAAFLLAGWTVAARWGTATAAPTPLPTLTATAMPESVAVQPPPDTRALLEAEERWLKGLYQGSSPSVVNITSRSYSYDFFFNVVPQEGSGSGFIWDDQGHIVTNFHVIEGAQELEVKFADGTQRAATVVGVDPANDLAVIKVEQSGSAGEEGAIPPPLPLAEGSQGEVGQRVVAIGNPFGLERTLTTGVISALGRVIQSESGDFIGEVIQHDAAINPGNSGGPLLDIDGRVLGVNTQIVSPSGASAGIGFAIPAPTVARVVPELIARGHYPHPWLGIEGIDVTPGLAQRLRRGGLPLDAEEGVLVAGIYRGGPAEGLLRGGTQRVRAGNLILPVGGDLIVGLDDRPITSQREMLLYLEGQKRVGDTVQVRFWREGQLQEVQITLIARPMRR